ncbi:hypothetical protein BSKO_06407 [Bryopsis sp. KO-2023]|nr:hypothetical protein BSKO_06407 [Bryopsis sp. KO-2023]
MDRQIALEVQGKWSRLLVTGKKTVETRRYPLPDDYIGKPIALIETLTGVTGRSGLPDRVPRDFDGAQLVAFVTFSSVVEYHSCDEFQSDFSRHLVSKDSGYGWEPGVTEVLYGWTVSSLVAVGPSGRLPAMHRMFRSLFEMDS